MHSPLILLARRSISSEPFSSVDLVLSSTQDIRPRDSTPVFQSSPTIFFSKPRPSICLITQIEAFFVPILALLWNPGKNWLVQRRDAVAKKGDRGVEGRKGLQSQT
jgi:hypothetical protein